MITEKSLRLKDETKLKKKEKKIEGRFFVEKMFSKEMDLCDKEDDNWW